MIMLIRTYRKLIEDEIQDCIPGIKIKHFGKTITLKHYDKIVKLLLTKDYDLVDSSGYKLIFGTDDAMRLIVDVNNAGMVFLVLANFFYDGIAKSGDTDALE